MNFKGEIVCFSLKNEAMRNESVKMFFLSLHNIENIYNTFILKKLFPYNCPVVISLTVPVMVYSQALN